MSRPRLIAALTVALALCCPLSSFGRQLQARQNPAPPASFFALFQEQGTKSEAGRAGTQQEDKQDPNEAFRHSGSVKLVSRITGLSEDAAFWLCMALNFIAVVVVLWVLLRKILPTAFRNRTEAIQRRLEEARKTSEEARRRLADVEARLSRLDVEIGQMRNEADASARHEEERVMAAAEEERRRIVESAEQEIARAANAARRELKAYAAELGVSLAEKKIRIEVNTDQKLVREFTARLGKDGN